MKYIIEIKPEYEDTTRGIMVLGARDSNLYMDALAVEDLKELNADYINENYGSLQDDAYQRGLEEGKKATFGLVADASNAEYQKGFEDGKAIHEKGCEGCKYECENKTKVPCILCSNNFKNQWTAKDDKIEVGDEVEWDNDFTGDRFIVTRIYQPYGKKEQCDGIDDDGDVYRAVLIESLVKTGRHFDIASILEDMRND